MPEEKKKEKRITTTGRARYNNAMKREARDNIGNDDYEQPEIRSWLAANYPKGLVG